MANEYIRREDAIRLAEQGQVQGFPWQFLMLVRLPSADVDPVVHAYWIPQKENYEFKEVWMKCSACGYPVSRWTGNTNFCPNCGAKMDAQREE